MWKPVDVKFTTTEGSHNEWENELHVEKETRPEGEGGDHRNIPTLSDVVKLMCGETVCHFQVKKYYYLPEYQTNKDSQHSCRASGMYLPQYSGVDPNWLSW